MMNAKFSFSARLNSKCCKFVFKKIKSIYFFIKLNVWIKDKKKHTQKKKPRTKPKKEYLFNLLDFFSRWQFSGGGKDSQTRWIVLGGGSTPQAVQKAVPVVEKMLGHERPPPLSNHTPLILLVLFIHVSLIGFTFKAGRSVRKMGHGWHSYIIACHIFVSGRTVQAFTNVYRVWAR